MSLALEFYLVGFICFWLGFLLATLLTQRRQDELALDAEECMLLKKQAD